MKDVRGKRIVYIKIMYREPKVATLESWLNIENLMRVGFCGIFKIFLKHREENGI